MVLRKKYDISETQDKKSSDHVVVELSTLDKKADTDYKNKNDKGARTERDGHIDNDTECGIFCWRPRALQCLARSLWTFVGFYGLSGLCLFASGFYIRSQLTSMERHFRVSSGRMGVLMAANDIGSIACVMFASHFGKFAHIPRLLASISFFAGLFVSALALVQVFDPVTLPSVGMMPIPSAGTAANGSSVNPAAASNPMAAIFMNPMLLCVERNYPPFSGMPPGGPGAAPAMSRPADRDRANGRDVQATGTAAMMGKISNEGTGSAAAIGRPGTGMGFDKSTTMKNSSAGGAWQTAAGTGMGFDMSSMMGNSQGQDIRWGYYYTFVIMVILGALGSPRIPLQVFYVETNVRDKTESGVKIGTLNTAMMLGNPLALFVGSVIGMIPVDLSDTQLSFIDPRWIGAWWLGFVIFGGCSMLFALPVCCLPKRIRHTDKRNTKSKKPKALSHSVEQPKEDTHSERHDSLRGRQPRPSNASQVSDLGPPTRTRWEAIKDFLLVTRRILTQPVVLLVLFSSFTMIVGMAGTMSFQLKYMENQYDMPAYEISLYLGIGMLLTVIVGTFTGGLITTRLKLGVPGMFHVSLVGQLVALACSIAFLFLGCDNHEVVGFNAELGNVTDAGCQCIKQAMLIVCGEDGRNYLSPCEAGCSVSDGLTFSKCAYVGGQGTAAPGFCSNCNLFIPFLAIVTLLALSLMITLTPHSLMVARLVPLRDQPNVMSLTSMVITVGMLVGPIIFGHIYDTTCSLWSPMGGQCVIHDKKALRDTFLTSDIYIRAGGLLALIIALILVHCKKGLLYQDSGIEETVVTTGFSRTADKSYAETNVGATDAEDGGARDGPGGRRRKNSKTMLGTVAAGRMWRNSIGELPTFNGALQDSQSYGFKGYSSDGEQDSRRVPEIRGIASSRSGLQGSDPAQSDGDSLPDGIDIDSALPDEDSLPDGIDIDSSLPVGDSHPDGNDIDNALPAGDNPPDGNDIDTALPAGDNPPDGTDIDTALPAGDKHPDENDIDTALPAGDKHPDENDIDTALPPGDKHPGGNDNSLAHSSADDRQDEPGVLDNKTIIGPADSSDPLNTGYLSLDDDAIRLDFSTDHYAEEDKLASHGQDNEGFVDDVSNNEPTITANKDEKSDDSRKEDIDLHDTQHINDNDTEDLSKENIEDMFDIGDIV